MKKAARLTVVSLIAMLKLLWKKPAFDEDSKFGQLQTRNHKNSYLKRAYLLLRDYIWRKKRWFQWTSSYASKAVTPFLLQVTSDAKSGSPDLSRATSPAVCYSGSAWHTPAQVN